MNWLHRKWHKFRIHWNEFNLQLAEERLIANVAHVEALRDERIRLWLYRLWRP